MALSVGLAPLAWTVARRGPESLGVTVDGDRLAPEIGEVPLDGWTWQAALTTGSFWVFALGAALYGLRSGPRNLDSGLSGISIVFQAAVPKPVVPKYTTSGVRRPSEL